MFQPQVPGGVIIYKYSSTIGRFAYLTTIPLSEDISSNFVRSRIVSAGMKLYTSTRPGGNFDVSGTFNAVVV